MLRYYVNKNFYLSFKWNSVQLQFPSYSPFFHTTYSSLLEQMLFMLLPSFDERTREQRSGTNSYSSEIDLNWLLPITSHCFLIYLQGKCIENRIF